MKKPNSRPSFLTPSGIASQRPVAQTLSSARDVIGHREEMMRTQDHRLSGGSNGWNPGAWGVFRSLEPGGPARGLAALRRKSARAPRSLGLVLDRNALPVTTTLHPGQPAVMFPGRDSAVSATAERHLLLALRSAEHERGAVWETAGFAALWLSGVAAIVIGLF